MKAVKQEEVEHQEDGPMDLVIAVKLVLVDEVKLALVDQVDEVKLAVAILVSQQDEQNPEGGPMDEVIVVDSMLAVIGVDSLEEVFEGQSVDLITLVDQVELSVALLHMDVLDLSPDNVPKRHSAYTAPYKASKNGHCTLYMSCDCNLYSFRYQLYIVDKV